MNIIRVFPRKTSFSPNNDYCYFDEPGFFRPEADEVHVSVTFTWDIEKGEHLASSWGRYYDTVKLGGPAFGSTGKHVPDRYVKKSVTFTTRGCNNNCPWCLVPNREGKLREIKNFAPGHIIQDNNLLQSTRVHQIKVFNMLNNQSKAAIFSGGIDSRLVDNWFADQMRSLRIKQIFLSADTESSLDPLEKALDKLSFLGRDKLRVYVLVAYDEESIEKADYRCKMVFELGGLPFAQLYQPSKYYINYPYVWKQFARKWSRPAIIKSIMS